MRRLEGLGAVFVDDEEEVPQGAICVLSAHGVAPAVLENCERRGLRVVDAVCPLVSKVHAEARRYADSGHLVALVGHRDHVEVIGTKGERPDQIVVVESPEEAMRARHERQAAGRDQPDDALARRRRLDRGRARRPLRRPASRPGADDICYATQNRQDAVKEIVSMGATLILVIGSPTSSNAQRLVEVAQARGAEATLIDGEDAIDDELLEGHEIVGLTAGASTPEELVQAVLARARRGRLRRARGGHGRTRGRPLPAAEAGGGEMTSVQIPHSVAAALPTLSVFDITNEISRDVSSGHVERGIAYVTAAVPRSLVRVSERESGFFCDVESLLERLVPDRPLTASASCSGCSARARSRSRSRAGGSASASGSACCSSASTATPAPSTR